MGGHRISTMHQLSHTIFNRSLVMVVFMGLLFVCTLSAATEHTHANPWTLNPPTVELLGDTATKSTPSVFGNKNCLMRTLVLSPATPNKEAKTRHECTIETEYGTLSGNGFLLRQGTGIWGMLYKSGTKTPANMAPVPNTNLGLKLSYTNNGAAYVTKIYNTDSYITTKTLNDGTVTHYLTNDAPAKQLTDKSGTKLAIDLWSAAYSANSQWLVADMPNVTFARINMGTLDVVPFGIKTNHNKGYDPGFLTAISPDGRHAVLSSKNVSVFRLYDLWTCSPAPNRITEPADCESVDLLPLIKQQVPNLAGTHQPKFTDDFSLEIQYSYTEGGKTKSATAAIRAAGTNDHSFDYLALGDSFASGEGAYGYKAYTDTPDNKCHLSLRSYPYLISEGFDYGQFESVACSGSVIDNVNNLSPEYLGQTKPEIPSKDRDKPSILNSYLVGQIAQIEFIDKYKPNVITISISGNDIGFSDIIKRCVSVDTCYGYYEERLELLSQIDSQFDRLASLYAQIKNNQSYATKIYAIGYPELSYPAGNCAANVHLNRGELEFANNLTNYLNSMIKQAADKAGVFYVDVSDALAGYRFCETVSSDIAVNGLTAGKDSKIFGIIQSPIGNESFHPNERGHQLLKNSILRQTNYFTAPMPLDQPNLTRAKPSDDLAVLKAPKKGGMVKSLLKYIGKDETDDVPEIIAAGDTWGGHIGNETKLAANSQAEIWLFSTPQKIGTVAIGQDGHADLSVTIPAGTTPGFHTIRIYATTVTNEPVDINTLIYVAANTADIDGDGAINELDPCPSVAQSNIDADQDGTDDACDAVIGAAPQPELAPPEVVPQPEDDPKEPSDPTSAPLPEPTTTPAPTEQDNTEPAVDGYESPPQAEAVRPINNEGKFTEEQLEVIAESAASDRLTTTLVVRPTTATPSPINTSSADHPTSVQVATATNIISDAGANPSTSSRTLAANDAKTEQPAEQSTTRRASETTEPKDNKILFTVIFTAFFGATFLAVRFVKKQSGR